MKQFECDSQMSIFDYTFNPIKITNKIRLIELFAGYGSQALALKYLGVSFESYKICEWAVKSIQAYKDLHFTNDNYDYSKMLTDEELIDFLTKKGISANYNEPMTREKIKRLGETQRRNIFNNIIATHNLVNIQQCHAKDLEIVETDKYTYIMTYSFPCQDLSSAGKGLGMAKGSGTRSGMLWEVERILDECKEYNGNLPKILLMENVPEVCGSKNQEYFKQWLNKLEDLGYQNYWKCLNAKNYGIPQNRNRCFMVSILGNNYYEFPKPLKFKKELNELLEDKVDESFYLSDKQLIYVFDCNRVCDNTKRGDLGDRVVNPQIAKTISRRGEESQRADITNFVVGDNTKEYTVGEIREEINLKRELCNKLLKNNMIKKGDVIRHSYTKNRLDNGDKNMGRIESQERLCPTLDTRCDCLGVVVEDE